jgi:hypothetical protein
LLGDAIGLALVRVAGVADAKLRLEYASDRLVTDLTVQIVYGRRRLSGHGMFVTIDRVLGRLSRSAVSDG